MKKDDIIEKLKFLEPGRTLLTNLKSQAEAEDKLLDIDEHFCFKDTPSLEVKQVEGLGWCIVCGRDCYLALRAKVKWVFNEDFAVEYLDTGGCEVLSTVHEDGQGWSVIHEATPVYQDSVEHLTDEQLRASIEDLRERRLSAPNVVRKTRTAVPKVTASKEDNELSQVLKGKSDAEIQELRRKLGLCD